MVRDLTIDDKGDRNIRICVGCVHGKQQCLPFPTEGAEKAKDILQIIHTDICGPMKTVSVICSS